jgi:hypothetical protein
MMQKSLITSPVIARSMSVDQPAKHSGRDGRALGGSLCCEENKS